jgi:hypothetical protein
MKKRKYQYDNCTGINKITNNYYWADGMTSTFRACARKAGITNSTAQGFDFTEFWNKYHDDKKDDVHPSKIREVIHWFFEKSVLKRTCKITTSQEFLEKYFSILKLMNNLTDKN